MNNKEIVKSWFTALDAKDFNALKNLMSGNYKFHNPMSPIPMNAEEHLAMMHGFTSAFEAKHKINDLFGEADYVGLSGTWGGKHTGEFMGMPATGKLVEFDFVAIYKIENGKVLTQHIEFNPMTMMAQLGAAPSNA